MLAVCCRAYHAALYIMDAVQRLIVRPPLPTEDVPLPPLPPPLLQPTPPTTEEKLKCVLSAWFAKGDSSESNSKKLNYPPWIIPTTLAQFSESGMFKR